MYVAVGFAFFPSFSFLPPPFDTDIAHVWSSKRPENADEY